MIIIPPQLNGLLLRQRSLRKLMDPLLWNYVLEKGLEEDLLPMPNFTERRDKDREVVPQSRHCLFVARHPHVRRPPASSPSPSPRSSPSPLPSPLSPSIACHPCCHHSCHQSHRSLLRTPPSLPTPSPTSSPLPSSSPTTLISIAIALPPSPSSSHAPIASSLFFFTPSGEPTSNDLMVDKAGSKTSY